MNWIRVNNRDDMTDMPRDRIFLSIWAGRFSLTRYDEDNNCWWICFDPLDPGHMKIESGQRFQYWTELPKDYFGELDNS